MPLNIVYNIIGRLPLLFVVDSILRGTFLDFTFILSYGIPLSLSSTETPGEGDGNWLYQLLWSLSSLLVMLLSIVLIFSPVTFILDFYRWISGVTLIWISHHCNKRYVQEVLVSRPQPQDIEDEGPSISAASSMWMYSMNLLIQLLISLAFNQISVACVMKSWKQGWVAYSRYPVDFILYLSFSLPVLMESIYKTPAFSISDSLSVVMPLLTTSCHLCFVVHRVSQEVIVPGVLRSKSDIRELGVDGLVMNVTKQANLSWLLRSFFLAQLIHQLVLSRTLREHESTWFDLQFWKSVFLHDVLYNMCGTLITIMSLASVVTIFSRFCLSCAYKIIQANDEEETLQPAVAGFLFVLCAMQTGITSVNGDLRLQLLFQNSILLVVANLHFIHNVATDLLLKASTDDCPLERHVRPLIPFAIFFAFPFLVVLPLWGYPFRVSWLLAVTVFCIELIFKSLSTLTVYSINMVNQHTAFFTEDTDNVIFYVKGVSGCLEFICGIFLFLNGAYIFIFESGGFIRLFMMTVHFYCNIYQSLLKGWATYKLRLSSWEKVDNLDAATQEQLDDNDTCSICYQELKEAVSLNCSHIFHKNCLQKWLSIKETCPLCHEELEKQQPKDTPEDNR